ncbi:integrase [Halobacteriales archaeon SW_10_68_16]|nr:MAG: integrase [Halobacteriales archaeon SW_10_68_16]
MANPETQLENLRDRIEENDEISADDREALEEFDKELVLRSKEYSTYRHLKLLRHVTIIAENVGGLNDALIDRKAVKDIVAWIHRTYENEETNQDYRVALKVFGRKVTDDGVANDPEQPPVSMYWVSSTKSENYDASPDKRDMLEWEDIMAMVEEAQNKRDAAAITLQFDAGLRGFEFEDLTRRDIEDTPNGLRVHASGKTGSRTALLIPSVPYIQEWLEEHPAPNDPDAPLWCKLDSPERLSYRMISQMFKKPGQRADIDKPLNITNFRKSSASFYAGELTQPYLEKRYGWVKQSDAAARYIAIFSDDVEKEILKIHGIETEEETEDIAPVECYRCTKLNTREARFCSRCGQVIQPEAMEDIMRIDGSVKDGYQAADDMEDVEKIHQLDSLVQDIKNEPELMEALIEELNT